MQAFTHPMDRMWVVTLVLEIITRGRQVIARVDCAMSAIQNRSLPGDDCPKKSCQSCREGSLLWLLCCDLCFSWTPFQEKIILHTKGCQK